MVAGLAFQVVSLIVFMVLWIDFIACLRKANDSLKNERLATLRAFRKFKLFQYGKSHHRSTISLCASD